MPTFSPLRTFAFQCFLCRKKTTEPAKERRRKLCLIPWLGYIENKLVYRVWRTGTLMTCPARSFDEEPSRLMVAISRVEVL